MSGDAGRTLDVSRMQQRDGKEKTGSQGRTGQAGEGLLPYQLSSGTGTATGLKSAISLF